MKFGIQLPHFGPLASGDGTLAVARFAAELGFDSVWVGDHIAYPAAFAERFGRAFYEAITTLTYVAAVTPRIRVGTAVLVLPYRNPLVLAKELATLDVLSGGRLTVGVGAGWMAEEHAILGAPYAERGAYTDEALRILRTLWTDDRPVFRGQYFRFEDVLFAPRPHQHPAPPIWVGGDSPRALRRAAEHGEGWLPIWHKPTNRGFSPDELTERIATLGEMTRRAGRSVRHEVAAVMPLAILDRRPTTEEAQPLVGPPEVLGEMLGEYGGAGLGHVILSPYYGLAPALLPARLEDVERLLERFAREVRPLVARGSRRGTG